MSDILMALDNGDIALLTLLDLSAAFDAVDHATLLKRLEISYGLKGHLLGWFELYLTGRKQSVRCGNSRSLPTLILYGVSSWSRVTIYIHTSMLTTHKFMVSLTHLELYSSSKK